MYDRVIITGATGWLAYELALQIRESMPDVWIFGVSRSGTDVYPFDSMVNNDRYVYDFRHKCGDVVVHNAFCRRDNGRDLAESLEWSRAVFAKAILEGASGIVNISSQGVYGGGAADNTEEVSMSPTYLYAMAKSASEVLLSGMAEVGNYYGGATNLRMASLVGVSGGSCPNNVLYKFASKALAGETIKIVGGKQRFSFLSVHDAASAIIRVLSVNPTNWSSKFNIGPIEQVSIMDMAKTISIRASLKNGGVVSKIELQPAQIELDAGFRTDLAREKLGWCPHQTFVDIVDETMAHILSERHVS